MSKEFLQILFDPYSQEYGLAHKEQKGTGLGLSIAKQIVELAGGQITVTSELGKGTEFIVDAYAMDSGQKPLKKTRKDDILGNLQSIHVLVVDDTEINSFVIKKLLEYKGCNVDVAMNGQEAIELFTATEPYYYDIILTDIGMPVMDGFEEARQIRAMEREDGKTIPIIAATADGYDDMYAKILEAGMNERLVKPINAELLYETILRLIKK